MIHSPLHGQGQTQMLSSSPSSDGLVRIGENRTAFTPLSRILNGPFVDKFFLFGALAAIVGITYYGVHLWLMLNSQVPLIDGYQQLRSIHASIQQYLFLNIFLYGFLMQTTAKLYEAPILPPAWTLIIIPTELIGVVVTHAAPDQLLGSVLLALPPLAVLSWAIKAKKEGRSAFRFGHSSLVFFGLASLAFQPFAAASVPANALLFFIAGAVPIVLAALQQFIFAFLNGSRLTSNQNRILVLSLMMTSLSFAFAAFSHPSYNLTPVTGGLLVAVLLLFGRWTQINKVAAALDDEPFRLAVISGYVWALLSSCVMILSGSIDITFHLFVLGWILPLIITSSVQIVSHISQTQILSRKFLFVLILLWQIVPLGRAATLFPSLLGELSLLVGFICAVVILPWAYSLALGSLRTFKRQLRDAGCPMMGSNRAE